MKSLTKLMLASALMVGCGSSASIIPFVDGGEPFLFDSGSSDAGSDTGSDADSGTVIVLHNTDAGSSSSSDTGSSTNSDTGSSTSSDTGTSTSSDSGSSTSSDSGHTTTVGDAGVDSGHSEDAGVDSGRHHGQPDAGDCQEQFNCCLQDCDDDNGAQCDRDHCKEQCQEQFEQCLGQGGCQH